jgi:PIN domain nuclease of toxin-antitoxin system
VSVLLDTHLLLWIATGDRPLPSKVRALLEDSAEVLHFSVASIWEVAIKYASGRSNIQIDPVRLRQAFLAQGYVELEITSLHAMGVAALPPIHGDPFDRLLLSQALAEDLTLLTADRVLARYPGPIQRV